MKEYKACQERVAKDTTGEAHCTGQYLDFWKCVDRCVRTIPSAVDSFKPKYFYLLSVTVDFGGDLLIFSRVLCDVIWNPRWSLLFHRLQKPSLLISSDPKQI